MQYLASCDARLDKVGRAEYHKLIPEWYASKKVFEDIQYLTLSCPGASSVHHLTWNSHNSTNVQYRVCTYPPRDSLLNSTPENRLQNVMGSISDPPSPFSASASAAAASGGGSVAILNSTFNSIWEASRDISSHCIYVISPGISCS